MISVQPKPVLGHDEQKPKPVSGHDQCSAYSGTWLVLSHDTAECAFNRVTFDNLRQLLFQFKDRASSWTVISHFDKYFVSLW